jgi:1,4-dihydroxy-6-naphthoate synthase
VRSLTFGFTPCPNDAFAFHALVHGLVEASFAVEPVLLDIEELNQRARTGELDLTKLSFGAAPAARDQYRLLRSGAALGHGVGPLVVTRAVAEGYERIAVPGRDTTAFLLLRLAWPKLGEVVEMRYDEILDAVASGAVDAGLIIHESRFTYAEHGLVRVVDLGEWWEAETGLPVPLAGIYAREGLPMDEVERAIRASVEYAFAHPEASREYVREHSHELSEDVCRAHIDLYVNEFSVDLGEPGLAAIERLASASLAA